MTQYTIKQVRAAALKACFYVNASGDYFRMQYTEDESFCAMDEDSGKEYEFTFEELVEDEELWHFKELTTIVI